MSEIGLRLAQEKLVAAGIHPLAIDVFTHYYRQLEKGRAGSFPRPASSPSRSQHAQRYRSERGGCRRSFREDRDHQAQWGSWY